MLEHKNNNDKSKIIKVCFWMGAVCYLIAAGGNFTDGKILLGIIDTVLCVFNVGIVIDFDKLFDWRL